MANKPRVFRMNERENDRIWIFGRHITMGENLTEHKRQKSDHTP
jgi:hypothetical protein